MKEFSTTTERQTTLRALSLINRQTPTLDLTQAIIVNRGELAGALKDALKISAVLHNFENLNDHSSEEMIDLCRAAYRASQALAGMLEAKEVNQQ